MVVPYISHQRQGDARRGNGGCAGLSRSVDTNAAADGFAATLAGAVKAFKGERLLEWHRKHLL